MNVPQVPVTGNIGSGGVFPVLNSGNITIPSDADYTMVYPETSGIVINVLSSVPLTAARAVVAPMEIGFWFIVLNNTTGGQAIAIASGMGEVAFVPNDGKPYLVVCDGTGYSLNNSAPSGISSITIATTNGFQGSSTGGSTPTLTLGVDGLHVLPVNTGSSLLFLNESGTYTAPAGSLGGTLTSSHLSFGPGAGASPTLTSIVGTDGNHRIQIVPGSGSGPGSTLFTIAFTTSRGHNTYPVFTQSGQTAFNQLCVPLVITSATGYTITTGQAGLTDGVPLTFNVSCP